MGKGQGSKGALKCLQASGSRTTSRGILLQVGNPRIEGGKLGVMGIVEHLEVFGIMLFQEIIDWDVRLTEKLKSYGAAKRKSCPGWSIARVAISTTAVRTRIGRRANASSACRSSSERDMPSAFCRRMAPLPKHPLRRHLLSASAYREEMKNRFESWAEITGTERPPREQVTS